MVILVDGGSTHNFIQTRVAKFLALPSSPTATLRVMVGNGHTLDYDTLSSQVPLSIQGHDFRLDLYHLPLCGADIVLWVQWPHPNHDFHTYGPPHHAPPTPSTASAHQIKRLAQTQSISSLFHITATQTPSSPPPSYIPPPPQLTSVLDRYFHIFADPTQLPPSHNI